MEARPARFTILPDWRRWPVTNTWWRWFDAQDPDLNNGHWDVAEALGSIYKLAGLKAPDMHWHDSPRAALAAMAKEVRDQRPTLFDDAPDTRQLSRQALSHSVAIELVDAYCDTTGRVVGSLLSRRGRNILPVGVPGLKPPSPSIEHNLWRTAMGSEFADRIASWAVAQMDGLAWCPEIIDLTAPWGVVSNYASWWWPMNGACHLARHPSEMHEVALSGMRQLHNPEGPALRFRDGFEVWMWGGVVVPERIVMEPETITLEEIERTRGALREVVIERFGMLRYLERTGAVCIQQDDFGKLFRHPPRAPFPEEIVFVKVRNSTPEPDGSIKDYRLRVPPAIRTARAAVAWTFGLNPKEYAPNAET